MSDEVRHPGIRVRLSGEPKQTLAILGRVKRALLEAEVSAAEVDVFVLEATGGDHDHLIRTVMEWVEVE